MMKLYLSYLRSNYQKERKETKTCNALYPNCRTNPLRISNGSIVSSSICLLCTLVHVVNNTLHPKDFFISAQAQARIRAHACTERERERERDPKMKKKNRHLIIFKQLRPLLLICWGEKVAFHVKWYRVKMDSFYNFKTFQLCKITRRIKV